MCVKGGLVKKNIYNKIVIYYLVGKTIYIRSCPYNFFSVLNVRSGFLKLNYVTKQGGPDDCLNRSCTYVNGYVDLDLLRKMYF